MRRLAVCVVAATIVPVASAAAPPPQPAPHVTGVKDSPPPAWLETSGGAVWLAYSSYCWRSTCADFVPVRCPDKRLPTVVLRRGETVRFHLQFRPNSVRAGIGRNTSTSLAAQRVTRWRVTGKGLLWLFVRARVGSMNGDASYNACVSFR